MQSSPRQLFIFDLNNEMDSLYMYYLFIYLFVCLSAACANKHLKVFFPKSIATFLTAISFEAIISLVKIEGLSV